MRQKSSKDVEQAPSAEHAVEELNGSMVKTIADLQKVQPQALPQLVRAHACLTWRYY